MPPKAPWPKGVSGNPNGRPKGGAGLAAKVRELVRGEDGAEGGKLVEFAVNIFADASSPFEHRRWAAEWLADRGFGKALQLVDVTSGGERLISPVASLAPERLAELDAFIRGDAGLPVIDVASSERPEVDITPPLSLPKPV